MDAAMDNGVCANTGCSNAGTSQCGRCHTVRYCSRTCQVCVCVPRHVCVWVGHCVWVGAARV